MATAGAEVEVEEACGVPKTYGISSPNTTRYEQESPKQLRITASSTIQIPAWRRSVGRKGVGGCGGLVLGTVEEKKKKSEDENDDGCACCWSGSHPPLDMAVLASM